MQATRNLQVWEDDDAHIVMTHDGTRDDIAGDGGCEGCRGEDYGEDKAEEEDFLDDIVHVEQELLLKTVEGLNNMETVQKARKEHLYEENGCDKRWRCYILC
jgi:hypothetical protein